MPGSGRSYERITLEDLGRLAEISRLDREDLFARRPRYRVLEDALICVALCQGAALHFVDGENGVKDFDVWTFYAVRPDQPAFPWRRRASRDFGDPRFGPPPDKPGFVGRRVDLLGRSVEVGAETDPASILRGYLSEGRTGSARALARKAAVLLEPLDRLGSVEAGERQASGAVDAPLERVRNSFRRQGLKRLLGAEVVSAGRRFFVCRAEVVAVEDGEERACANPLQTVSLVPVRDEPAGTGGGA